MKRTLFQNMISVRGIDIATSIFGLALSAFFKKSSSTLFQNVISPNLKIEVAKSMLHSEVMSWKKSVS